MQMQQSQYFISSNVKFYCAAESINTFSCTNTKFNLCDSVIILTLYLPATY